MGNSPSRNELHGDHMSSIVNNSGQETFQSHSYPAKFSAVPGIHNEQFNGTVVTAAAPAPRQSSAPQNHPHPEFNGGGRSSNGSGGNRSGNQNSGGPNTPDLLYSMDSLNVCGNNGTSITSAELPPSSISPANCRDPWSPSSFSDESLHTQCRNLSRLHKDLHHRSTDDEGLSSSTYESDSLNPAATLSGMASQKQPVTRPYPHHQQSTITKREVSPSGKTAEVAEEATEFEPPLLKSGKSEIPSAATTVNSVADLLPSSSSQLTDHSITINGRKVIGYQETPLPIIVGLQDDADLKNGHCVGSKIGITSSELNNSKASPPPPLLSSMSSNSSSSSNGICASGTIKRGNRMKSPPPPPPPSKANGNHNSGGEKIRKANDSEKAATAAPPETFEKMSSSNTLMRRNVSFGTISRKSCSFEVLSEDDNDVVTSSGDEVSSVTHQTQLPQEKQTEKVTPQTTTSTSSCSDHDEKITLPSPSSEKSSEKTKSTEEAELKDENAANKSSVSEERQAPSQDVYYDAEDDGVMRKEKSNANSAPTTNNKNIADKPTDAQLMNSPKSEEIKGKLPDNVDDTTDILIRPCELSKQSHSNHSSTIGGAGDEANDCRGKEVTVLLANASSSGGGIGDDRSEQEEMRLFKEEEERVDENCRETVNEQNHESTNKTELDCKDGKDVQGNDRNICSNIAENDEIKPVSCSSNVEDKKEEALKINTMMRSNKNDEDKNFKVIDGNKTISAAVSTNEDDGKYAVFENLPSAWVEFPEMSEKQLETGFGVASSKSSRVMTNAAKNMFFDVSSSPAALLDELEEVRSSGRNGIESKFGTDEEQEQQRSDKRGELSQENTPPRQLQHSASSPSSPVASETDPLGTLRGSKSGKSSTASSRRGSLSSSSVDLNLPVASVSSNGILNCNRMSLCSLPDNEVDVDSFESPPPPMLDSETILDQPLGWKPNGQTAKADVTDDIKEDDQNAQNTDVANGSMKTGKSAPERVNSHHQRKQSLSKIEFDWSKILGDKRSVASSAPTVTSPLEKRSISRKASFPELYINTLCSPIVRPLVERKHSVGGNEKRDHGSPNYTFVGSNDTKNPFLCSTGNEGEREGRLGKSQFAKSNDFLQTLGEIYASKSQLLKNTTQQPHPSTTKPPTTEKDNCKETTEPSEALISLIDAVPSEKSKAGDASIDTVDGFESQDRSISEYNISPRSARELVTESLLNGTSSISSSTVSQISIVTINESDVSTGGTTIPAPVPFSAGVETRDPFEDDSMTLKSGDTADIVIPRMAPSSSVTNGNSATFRKKPSFCRVKAPKEDPMSRVEIFEPPSSRLSSKNVNEEIDSKSNIAVVEEKSNCPVPPPMPPLQYCRNNSYSSTPSSSMGDSSTQSHEKSSSPRFDETSKPNGRPICRISPDRATPKLNGNTSSECSLIELSLANQKSTSDAIIVELRKAQAKKLKFAEQKSSKMIDQPNNITHDLCPVEPSTVAIIHVDGQTVNRSSRQEDLLTKVLDEHVSGSTRHHQTINENNHVGDPSVKTIVNGKHTNSIIVNETPIAVAKKDSLKRTRSGVNTTKSSIAQQRGNIMSPSLSGNYTEMNGIDSETMGASSIHEDELSGHLKQKENHINELHDNVDEVQTSNKLDGTSFRRVLSEYEKTLSMFIQQIDQLKQRMDEAETEKQTLIKERDQALEDLRNVESAFSDVHRKYERAKALLENMKSNEDTLIRRDQEMMQRIQNRDKKIDMIKEKAQESIEKMHLDYETRIKEMEFENAKLRAQYRKMEMKLSTLENDVEQKAKENAQLSALCDELINGQVGQV